MPADLPSPSRELLAAQGNAIARRQGASSGIDPRAMHRIVRHPALVPPCTRVEDTVLDLIEVAPTFHDAVWGIVTLRFGFPDLGDRCCETAAAVATLLQRGWPELPTL